MDEEDSLFLLSATVTLTAAVVSVLKRKKQKRKIWSRCWLNRRHIGSGILHMLNSELKTEDPNAFKNFLRLTSAQFEIILNKVKCDITKQKTFMRDPISARNKLAVTLRFLATGESYRSLMYSTRIHETTISRFVPIVCNSIIRNLMPEYLKIPSSGDEWAKIANEFKEIWNFPHCLGALDGRHIKFRPPISDGSFYFNYKGSNSIILLALADANYKFIYVNIGINGRISDAGAFQNCKLSSSMSQGTLNFPPPDFLPGSTYKVPFVIVADDAFPLSNHLMKPYPQQNLTHDCRIFNYRLSRARRVVENSFGILANRFRILLNPIHLSANKVEKITLTCVILHNYLCSVNGTMYTNVDTDAHMFNLQNIGHQVGSQSNNSSRIIRDEFKNYFNSEYGCVPWQDNAVRRFNL